MSAQMRQPTPRRRSPLTPKLSVSTSKKLYQRAGEVTKEEELPLRHRALTAGGPTPWSSQRKALQ